MAAKSPTCIAQTAHRPPHQMKCDIKIRGENTGGYIYWCARCGALLEEDGLQIRTVPKLRFTDIPLIMRFHDQQGKVRLPHRIREYMK